jgi:hypothetical protein
MSAAYTVTWHAPGSLSDPGQQLPGDHLTADDAKEHAEEVARKTIGPLCGQLHWRLLNDGTKPGNYYVAQLMNGPVYVGYDVRGPHIGTP